MPNAHLSPVLRATQVGDVNVPKQSTLEVSQILRFFGGGEIHFNRMFQISYLIVTHLNFLTRDQRAFPAAADLILFYRSPFALMPRHHAPHNYNAFMLSFSDGVPTKIKF